MKLLRVLNAFGILGFCNTVAMATDWNPSPIDFTDSKVVRHFQGYFKKNACDPFGLAATPPIQRYYPLYPFNGIWAQPQQQQPQQQPPQEEEVSWVVTVPPVSTQFQETEKTPEGSEDYLDTVYQGKILVFLNPPSPLVKKLEAEAEAISALQRHKSQKRKPITMNPNTLPFIPPDKKE